MKIRKFLKKIIAIITIVSLFATQGSVVSFAQQETKTLYFLGSSVTYGSATNGVSFVNYLSQTNGWNTVKYAVSGTTLVDNGSTSYIQRMLTIPTTVSMDHFTCQLSTNDASQGKPLGTISESENLSDFDTTTIIGAMEYIISYAKQTWDCPVSFYTNPYYNNNNYVNMVNALYRLQDKWDVGIIDFYNFKGMTPLSATTMKSYMADDIHPNATGYRWMTGVMTDYYNGVTSLEEDISVTKIEAESVAPDYEGKCTDSATYNDSWGTTESAQLKIENDESGSFVSDTANGDWIKYTVDCLDRLDRIAITYENNSDTCVDARVEVRLDDVDGQLIGEAECVSDETISIATISQKIIGEHDIYFVITGQVGSNLGRYDYIEFFVQNKKPKLEAVKDGAEVLSYVNFKDELPDGVTQSNVEIDTKQGVGMFFGNSKVDFPASVTSAIKQAGKQVVVEFVTKTMRVAEHEIVMSLGNDSSQPYIVIGLRNDDSYKYNEVKASAKTLAFNEWATVKYIIRRGSVDIFLNGKMLYTANSKTNLDNISGNFRFGLPTVSQFADPGYFGRVSEIRLSVEPERRTSTNTAISVSVDGTELEKVGNTYTMRVNSLNEERNVVITPTDEYTIYDYNAQTGVIRVVAESGAVKEYRLNFVLKSSNTDVSSIKVDGVSATKSGEVFAVNVPKANTHSVLVTVADKNASYVYDSKAKTVTVTAENGTVKVYKLNIIETVAVTSVSLKGTKATLNVGDTKTLTATVQPSDVTNKTVKFSTSNSRIATVSASGKITAKAVGTAKITATAGVKAAIYTVKVNPKKPTNFKIIQKGNKLTIKFKKGVGAKSTKIVILKNSKAFKTVTVNKSSYVIKKIKKGKYKVRLQAVQKVSGKKYTSGYTAYKTKKIK